MTKDKSDGRFSLKQLLDGVSEGIEDLQALTTLGQQLAANRAAIVTAVRDGAIEDARERLRAMCMDKPAIAGVVNYVMTQDPDSAINAIELYDKPLAESLRGCRENFVRLQTSWANVRDNPPRGAVARP